MVGLIFSSISAINAMDNADINSNNVLTDDDVIIASNSDDISVINANDGCVSLVAPDIVKYYKNDTHCDATLNDKNGNPLSNQSLTFTVKGVSYVKVTNENGVATLPINLSPGSYLISVSYFGDSLFTVDSNVVVLPTVVGGDLTKYYNNGSGYSVKLVNPDGTPLANSRVDITVKGKTYSRTTNSDGVATLPIGLSQGQYTVKAQNMADKTYREDTITVLPTVVGGDVKGYYKNVQYYVTLVKNDGTPLSFSKLSYNIAGKTYSWTSDSQGKAKLVINLSPGTYTITTTNLADKTSRQDTITVLPTIIGGDVTKRYNNGTGYTVKLIRGDGSPLANSKVAITVKGKTYTQTTNSNGVATLGIGLSQGTYTITAQNVADKTSVSNKIVVLPNIECVSGTKYYKSGNPYTVKLYAFNGKTLANAKVQFVVNGKTYTSTSDSNGLAKLNLGTFGKGTYTIKATNMADKTYITTTVQVLPSVSGSNVDKLYLDYQKPYVVTVVDDTGKPLQGAQLKCTISSKNYYITTDANGVAKLEINLYPGSYTVKTVYMKTGESCSNSIKVTGNVRTNIYDVTTNIKENSGNTFQVRLTNNLKHEIAKVPVIMVIDGKSYTSYTNKQGIASFNPDVGVGNYDVTYVFLGDNYMFGAYKDSKISILNGKLVQIEVKDDILHQGDNFEVTVKDTNGKPLANLSGFFTVKGNNYNVLTDDDGVAKLKMNLIPSNVLVTYTVNENGYSFVKQSSYVKIIDSDKVKFNSNIVNYGKGQKLQVNLLIGDIPFSNQHVILKINNKDYDVVTDKDGIASLEINLNPGKYDVICTYDGNSKIQGVSKTISINVLNKMETKFEYLGSTTLYKENKNKGCTVKLTGSNGLPIAGETVKFTIKGSGLPVSYNKITDENGIATLPINLNQGTYTFSYSYGGNSQFSGTSGSKSVKIGTKLYNRNSYYVISISANMNFANLKKLGTTDLFIHSYNIVTYGEQKFMDWVKTVNSYGIYVHLWVSIYQSSGPNYSPVLSNGQPDYTIINQALAEAKYYSTLDVDGISLDFVRFPSNAYKYSIATSLINNLVKDYSNIVRSYNPDLILSFACIARAEKTAYYFGQDVPTISKYVDVVIPLIYKSSFVGNKNAIIYNYAKWAHDHSSVPIWASLLGYRADALQIPIPLSELYSDCRIVISAGASGISIYKWGKSYSPNFGTLF